MRMGDSLWLLAPPWLRCGRASSVPLAPRTALASLRAGFVDAAEQKWPAVGRILSGHAVSAV
jgi:hypothetical protein